MKFRDLNEYEILFEDDIVREAESSAKNYMRLDGYTLEKALKEEEAQAHEADVSADYWDIFEDAFTDMWQYKFRRLYEDEILCESDIRCEADGNAEYYFEEGYTLEKALASEEEQAHIADESIDFWDIYESAFTGRWYELEEEAQEIVSLVRCHFGTLVAFKEYLASNID